MKLKVIKAYRRKNKFFFILELDNTTGQDQSKSKLLIRPCRIRHLVGDKEIKIPYRVGLVRADTVPAGETVVYRTSFEAADLSLLSGKYEIRFGLVREGVTWYDKVDAEFEVK